MDSRIGLRINQSLPRYQVIKKNYALLFTYYYIDIDIDIRERERERERASARALGAVRRGLKHECERAESSTG